MAHDAFISYSTKDKPIADAACAKLESRGIRCWIAPRDILPGSDWGEAIIDAINQSSLMILVFSSSANASPQIKREVERAVNKGIPIIPFRIENVPLSKSLEYFISTPHWLDALTQPLEQHLDYLSQTVSLFLQKKEERHPAPPIPGAVAPISSPRVSPAIWIVGILFAVLLLAALAYYALKPSPKDASIDPGVVGNWQTNVVVDGKNWNLRLDITPEETFQLVSSTEDSGTYTAQNGRWRAQSVRGEVDGGTYQVANANSMSMTGKLGTANWTRSGESQSRGQRLPSLDTQVIGSWKTNPVINGLDFELTFEMSPNGQYHVTSVTEDSGTFHAQNGRCDQISRKGQNLQCTYQVLSNNSISLTGPLGTAVWSRVSQ